MQSWRFGLLDVRGERLAFALKANVGLLWPFNRLCTAAAEKENFNLNFKKGKRYPDIPYANLERLKLIYPKSIKLKHSTKLFHEKI